MRQAERLPYNFSIARGAADPLSCDRL